MFSLAGTGESSLPLLSPGAELSREEKENEESFSHSINNNNNTDNNSGAKNKDPLLQKCLSVGNSKRIPEIGNAQNLQNSQLSQTSSGSRSSDNDVDNTSTASRNNNYNASDYKEQEGEILSSRRSYGRTSFPMIPSLRNSLRSSVNSEVRSKKNSTTKDINSIMEIYDLISVKDFGYPVFHSLHYGLSNYELYLNNLSSSQLDGHYNSNNKNSCANRNDFGFYDDQGVNEEEVSEDHIQGPPGTPVQKAIAVFDFEAQNDNELELRENQLINILYRHGQGWLVGEDPQSGNTGLVPEDYVDLVFEEEDTMYTADQLAQEGTAEGVTDEENDNYGNNDRLENFSREPDELSPQVNPITSRSLLDSDNTNVPSANARTTQFSNSPINSKNTKNDINYSPINGNGSNYTLLNVANKTISPGKEFQFHIQPHHTFADSDKGNNTDLSLSDNEHHDETPSKLTAGNYVRFLTNSATTPTGLVDKSADSSGSDKFSTELESEASDLQIDNTEMKQYLPEIFSHNSNIIGDSPSSLSNSVSFPRFRKPSVSGTNVFLFSNPVRNSSGYSSGSNSLVNGKPDMRASSSFNSNLNFSLTFGNGSPSVGGGGTAANRRGSILFGNGLMQSKSTNSINLKMAMSSSMRSIPRSTSLAKSFGGLIVNEDEADVEGFAHFKPPNLLSKDNYFASGGFSGGGDTSFGSSVIHNDNDYDETPKKKKHSADITRTGERQEQEREHTIERQPVYDWGDSKRESSENDDDDDFWVDDDFKQFEKSFQNRLGQKQNDGENHNGSETKAFESVSLAPVPTAPEEKVPQNKIKGLKRALSRKFSKIRLKNG